MMGQRCLLPFIPSIDRCYLSGSWPVYPGSSQMGCGRSTRLRKTPQKMSTERNLVSWVNQIRMVWWQRMHAYMRFALRQGTSLIGDGIVGVNFSVNDVRLPGQDRIEFSATRLRTRRSRIAPAVFWPPSFSLHGLRLRRMRSGLPQRGRQCGVAREYRQPGLDPHTDRSRRHGAGLGQARQAGARRGGSSDC